MSRIRRYSELIRLPSFFERFEYLKLAGKVGEETFGFDRYLNQILYKTQVWKKIRREVILRDGGNDLADPERPFGEGTVIVVHHMNPITIEDVKKGRDKVFDPEFLISASSLTHRAIHFGSADLLATEPVERRPGDTIPWR